VDEAVLLLIRALYSLNHSFAQRMNLNLFDMNSVALELKLATLLLKLVFVANVVRTVCKEHDKRNCELKTWVAILHPRLAGERWIRKNEGTLVNLFDMGVVIANFEKLVVATYSIRATRSTELRIGLMEIVHGTQCWSKWSQGDLTLELPASDTPDMVEAMVYKSPENTVVEVVFPSEVVPCMELYLMRPEYDLQKLHVYSS